MFPSTKNSASFWFTTNSNCEEKSSHPFGSYPKPQISDLVVLAVPFSIRDILSSVSKGEYRYGFNGSEIDKEIKGNESNYSTEFRLFDTNLARFLSADPLYSLSPSWTPYRLLYCNPLNWIDPSGLLEWSPQMNSDGSISYISEEKDNMNTFKEQYGLTDNQANNIFKKSGISATDNLKKGLIISGEKVKEITGSEILKIDLNSKIGKSGNRRTQHLLFAFDHNKKQNLEKKDNGLIPLDLVDYFHHIGNPQKDAAIRFKGKVKIDGLQININVTSFPIGHFMKIDPTWPCDEIKQTKTENVMYQKYVFCYEGGKSNNIKRRISALTIQVPSGKESDMFEKRYLR
jgi:RHS repeat-associated protein